MTMSYWKAAILGVVAIGTLAVFTDDAEARHRRRHRNQCCYQQSYYGYDYGYNNCAPQGCAPNACGVNNCNLGWYGGDGYQWDANYGAVVTPCGTMTTSNQPIAEEHAVGRPTYEQNARPQNMRQDRTFQNSGQNRNAPIRTDANAPLPARNPASANPPAANPPAANPPAANPPAANPPGQGSIENQSSSATDAINRELDNNTQPPAPVTAEPIE